jgi:hypothetical protein
MMVQFHSPVPKFPTMCNNHLIILKFSHNQSILLQGEFPDNNGGGQHQNMSE